MTDEPQDPAAPDAGPVPRDLRTLNQVSAFRYVTAENAPSYRAIVEVFFQARQHYVIELRPAEVLERIRSAGLFTPELRSAEDLDRHLDSLAGWGNLSAAHDAAAVTRLSDFYRRRLLFHLTPVGEAAHRAVLQVEATVGRSGSLQATMLVKVRDALAALARLAIGAAPEQILGLLHDLFAAFDTLTEEANRFIGELDRSTGSERLGEERFAAYKQALLAYIGRFVEELRRLAQEIRLGIDRVEARGPGALVEAAARSADLPPQLSERDPVAEWRAERLARWRGVRTWFLGDPVHDQAPTVERLADVAVEAVVGLARALGRINERRVRPVDRAADFRTLARWFEACPDDGAAHALWHAAFGLAPARHFHLVEEDPEAAAPGVSWWDARPVEVPVRLRQKGSTSAAGSASAVADHSASREWLAQKRRRERAVLEAAARRFKGRTLTFDELGALDAAELEFLLALLDQALGARPAVDGTRAALSSDGTVRVVLHPPVGAALAVIEAPGGFVRAENYRIELQETARGAEPGPRVAGRELA